MAPAEDVSTARVRVGSRFRGTLANAMLMVIVEVEVQSEAVLDFKRETEINARKSLEEPGIARFDVLEQQHDPTCFMLIEVYRDIEAPARHKQTAHYAAWRDAVEPMMAKPRRSTKYHNVFPDDASGWAPKKRESE